MGSISTARVIEGNCAIHKNTTVIKSTTDFIREQTTDVKSLVLELIDMLNDTDLEDVSLIVGSRSAESNFALQRYLESASTYAETVTEIQPSSSTTSRSIGGSMEKEHSAETLAKYGIRPGSALAECLRVYYLSKRDHRF